jgi:hypothetical protein
VRYLYGDSTRSPLTSNVLEYLRDALDFNVYALGADERIKAGRAEMRALQERANVDIEELETFGRTIADAIHAAPKRTADSAAVGCAERLQVARSEIVDSFVGAVRQRLHAEMAHAEAQEAAERDGCVRALMALLVANEPPNSSDVVRRVRLADAGYQGEIQGCCEPLHLRWHFELGFPEGHLLSKTAHVDDVLAGFEVHAPELTGWFKKELKVRPQRLEHQRITEVVKDGAKIVIRLRDAKSDAVGFDLEADADTGGLVASRVVPNDEPGGGPFEVDQRDAPRLIELCEHVAGTLGKLVPGRLIEAKLGDEDVTALASFLTLVERMVQQLAPIVHDIALHSLEPTELVLRRQIGNNRREEIYVPRETLRAKYEGLPQHLRVHFSPLSLDSAMSRSVAPPAPPSPAPRSELAPSQPPAPPIRNPLVVPVVPPLPKTPDLGAAAEAESLPAIEVNPDERAEPVDEALAAALRKAGVFGKAGRTEDAYRAYAKIFADPTFATYSVEDQRHALRAMTAAKLPADGPRKPLRVSDARRDALRAALGRAQALLRQHVTPSDYELVGQCELALGERAAAARTFKRGLDLERKANPTSALGERLEQLLSATAS